MPLNCGVGEDSWGSLGLKGDPTSPFKRKSFLNIHWRDWYWSWNTNTLATWWEELTHWKKKKKKKTLMLEIIGGRRRRGRQRMRLLDGITDSMVWVDSGSWWWTWRPGVLQFMGSQRVGHHWAIELNWTEHGKYILKLQEGKTHTHTHTHTKNVNGATENLKPNYSSSNN